MVGLYYFFVEMYIVFLPLSTVIETMLSGGRAFISISPIF